MQYDPVHTIAQLITNFSPSSQLHMFLQLMQQAPVVLQALGMTADSLQQEIVKMEQADKLKVMHIHVMLMDHWEEYIVGVHVLHVHIH